MAVDCLVTLFGALAATFRLAVLMALFVCVELLFSVKLTRLLAVLTDWTVASAVDSASGGGARTRLTASV